MERTYIDNSEIKKHPLYEGLMGGAVVAAVFAVIAAVLLGVTVYQVRVTDPIQSDTLSKLKGQLQTKSSDEKLVGEARLLDTTIRRNELARQQFIQTGGIYLAGSLIAAAGCFLAARSMLKPAPVVPTEAPCSGVQFQQAAHTRFAVTMAAVVLGAGGLYAVLTANPKPQTPKNPPAQLAPTATAHPSPSAEQADWAESVKGQWPSFRGPQGDGVCMIPNIPDAWNEKENKGILWKVPVPQIGFGSPIVWGDKLFLSGATKDEQKLFCFAAADGKLLWTGEIKPITTAREAPEIMEDTGFAASTPAANGRAVCAIFATGDIGCFDMDGKRLWQKALGIPESTYGYAASLAVYDDRVIVQFDQGSEEGKSELIAMNLTDGAVLWQAKRPTPNTWTSPTVVKLGNQYQILTSGSPWLIGYDTSGKELWKASCLGSDIAPTQVSAAGLILAVQPYDKIYAFKLDNAAGDITESGKAWASSGDMPDVCSPVSDGKCVWTLTTSGSLSCFELADGKMAYNQALELECHASPVLVGDKLYILARNGQMIIAQSQGEYKELARCSVDEECYASPAFSEGRMYLRSTKSLYCIGKAP